MHKRKEEDYSIIDQLLLDVVAKFGNSPELDNYAALSDILYVSPSTLKKYFEHPQKRRVISPPTLDTFARYIGYEDFDQYEDHRQGLIFWIDGKEYSESEARQLVEREQAEPIGDEGIVSIPDDIFSKDRYYSSSVYITAPLKDEIPEKGLETYREFIAFLLHKTGFETRENCEAILRVFNGYPFSEKKILCDAASIRTFVFVIKYLFKSSRSHPKYKNFFRNVAFDPAPSESEAKLFLPGKGPVKDPDYSKIIGKGNGVPLTDIAFLQKRYPSCFPM